LDRIQKKFYYTGYLLFLCALIYIGVKLLSFIQDILLILIASIFFAYILLPVVNFFEKPITLKIPHKIHIFKKELSLLKKPVNVTIREKGFSRLASVFIVYVILLMIFVVILSYVVPNIRAEFSELVNNFPSLVIKFREIVDKSIKWLEPRLPENLKNIVPKAIEKYSTRLEEFTYKAATYTFNIAHKIVSIAISILLVPIFTFYILMDLEHFKSSFYLLVPENHREEITSILKEIDHIIGRYIRGQIFVSLFIFAAITIALLILGIDYAFLIGLISGIVNIIPYLGVIISLAPAIILALISKGIFWAILTFLVLEGIQLLESQVISPSIMGEAMGLPPLVIILSLVIGAKLMGVMGALLAIPLAAIIRVIVRCFIKRKVVKA